jgi:hypothetical protein
MKAMRAIWIGAVLAASGPAIADTTRMIAPPAGFRGDAEQASALGQRFAAASHFAGRATVTAAEAYVAAEPGVALFVTRATVEVRATDAPIGALARTALDEVRASSRRAELTGARAEETAWREHADDARQVSAELTWSDAASHTGETARIVVASDGARVVAVTGECLASDTADRGARAACQAALGSLDPGVPADKRVAIALPAAGDPAGQAAEVPPAPPSASMSERPGSRGLDDGRVVLPPQRIALDPPEADRRPVVLGAGLVLLAAVFWWNRKRREQIERADARRDRRDRTRRDADADDLHAAARGDHHEPDEPA